MNIKSLILISSLIGSACFAQTNSANPYNRSKVDRVPSRIVHSFDRFTFLESIASGPDDSLYATSLFEGILYRQKDGVATKLTTLDGMLAGLTFADDNHLLVTGTSKQEGPLVLRVNTTSGNSEIIARFPEAKLLNGITKLSDGVFLIADSFKGVIWKLDIKNGATSLWLDHDLLHSPAPEKQQPGVNGIKLHNHAIYISNTNKKLLVKIPLNANQSPATPEIVHENIFMDDFEIASDGTLYGATHIYDSIIKITPKGDVSVIAQSDQGVAGSTCLTWKQGSGSILFVSTNGGMNSTPDRCNVVPSKIVQLNLAPRPSLKNI